MYRVEEISMKRHITKLKEENEKLHSMISNMSITENNLQMRLIEAELKIEELKEVKAWAKRAYATFLEMSQDHKAGTLTVAAQAVFYAPDQLKGES